MPAVEATTAPPRMGSDRVDAETFYACMLLALSAVGCQDFTADGERFHQAFKSAVDAAKETRAEVEVEDLDWMVEDSTYGIMPHAEEMLAFGQSARLISLANPDLVRAKVRYLPAEAKEELARITSHVSWFENVARAFSKHYPR